MFSGDIGCYTLGNAQPLDMVDTCLCMGADVTVAQGLHRMEPDAINFPLSATPPFPHRDSRGDQRGLQSDGDQADGAGQLHHCYDRFSAPPGTGQTMMGEISEKVSIEAVFKAIGVSLWKPALPSISLRPRKP